MLSILAKRSVNKTVLSVEEKALLSGVSADREKESSSSSDARVLPRGKPDPPPALWPSPPSSSSEQFPGSAPLYELPDFPLKLNAKQVTLAVRRGSKVSLCIELK